MECYCPDSALQIAVSEALESYGLDAIPLPASRKPARARTFADQSRRIFLGSAVLAEVRREMPVADHERQMIYRMVDAACSLLEDDELLEPTDVPLVDRQDVKPLPMTPPSRRPDRQKPPGTEAPVKANPSRAVRSVRWVGKGASR
jgi:hypothetical protein